ncbi:MAG: hypothetical protein IKH04_07980 [Kiritimatiellae bacterium]|nr:hypothetical protein [Kiritimatiellia bacterium]
MIDRRMQNVQAKLGLSIREMSRLVDIGYFDAPASKGHHLAVAGGLYDHSLNVALRLVSISRALCVEWSRAESPWVVGMLHDLVKCKCYRLNQDGKTYSYVQPEWPGHGFASAMIATVDLGIHLEPDEATAIIHHMGAFGLQGRALDEFDAALDKWPAQIIATHTADWAAARIDETGDWSGERSEP